MAVEVAAVNREPESMRHWWGGDKDIVYRESLKEAISVYVEREIGSKCKVEGPLKTMATSRRCSESNYNGSHTKFQSTLSWAKLSGAEIAEKPVAQVIVFDINTDAYAGKGD